MNPTVSTRIWDLPTRLFHWLLAAAVIALVITAKVGGNAMEWHLRLGHFVLALLLFRLIWGLFGGRWSRFASFVPSPARVIRYLRGQAPHAAGHSPLGALSVIAMLLILIAQVGTGLVSDDEISFAGSLTRFVSGDTIGWATVWHKGWGQWLLYALLGLHVLAIAYYSVARRQRLVPAMVHGNAVVTAGTPASQDRAIHRAAALAIALLCALAAWWVYGLGAPSF